MKSRRAAPSQRANANIPRRCVTQSTPYSSIRGEDHLGICLRPEPMPALLQLRAQFAEVVDFAVEGDPQAGRHRRHRLPSGGREIDNRETAVSETHGPVSERATPVWPTMRQQITHPVDPDGVNRSARTEIHASCDAAHCCCLLGLNCRRNAVRDGDVSSHAMRRTMQSPAERARGTRGTAQAAATGDRWHPKKSRISGTFMPSEVDFIVRMPHTACSAALYDSFITSLTRHVSNRYIRMQSSLDRHSTAAS